jgi:hypothetical protein
VDMRHVTFIDSTGIGALVAGYHAARTAGVAYRVGRMAPVCGASVADHGSVRAARGHRVNAIPRDHHSSNASCTAKAFGTPPLIERLYRGTPP